jgi:hypothetical protein
MELIIIIAVALVALVILVATCGVDSRDRLLSSEERYADFGAVWPDVLLHEAVRPRRARADPGSIPLLLAALPLLHG